MVKKSKINLFVFCILCLSMVACNNDRSPITYKSKQKPDKETQAVAKNESKKDKKSNQNIEEDSAEELFASSEIVEDSELGETRGAFMTNNGLIIDIGLMTQTLVNGVLVDQYQYSSANNLGSIDGIQQLIKISETGDVTVDDIQLSEMPSFLTMIQNSANNQFIQNFNILNLDIKNMQNYRQQGLVPTLNFHSSF